jgi:hypothetical protein
LRAKTCLYRCVWLARGWERVCAPDAHPSELRRVRHPESHSLRRYFNFERMAAVVSTSPKRGKTFATA